MRGQAGGRERSESHAGSDNGNAVDGIDGTRGGRCAVRQLVCGLEGRQVALATLGRTSDEEGLVYHWLAEVRVEGWSHLAAPVDYRQHPPDA